MTKCELIMSMTPEEFAIMLGENEKCCMCAYNSMRCANLKCSEGIRQWLMSEVIEYVSDDRQSKEHSEDNR